VFLADHIPYQTLCFGGRTALASLVSLVRGFVRIYEAARNLSRLLVRTSCPLAMTCGVPQGSVLGSLFVHIHATFRDYLEKNTT